MVHPGRDRGRPVTIERYEAPPPARLEVDSWVDILAPVADLASKISTTAFVPDSMRGNTAAVAAAILTGREMGVGPMTSLRHMHIIKGKTGQSAELMRALVLSHGHQIRYVETTETRCVVEGRRAGEQDWTRVMFTADQARRAKIDLGPYPEDKLVARATARLCRRLFADVIAGMPYTTEELEDLDEGAEPRPTAADAAPAEKPKRRTARRAARKTAEPDQADQPAATGDQAPPVEPARPPAMPAPPLPGEPGYDEPGAPAEPVEPEQRAQAEPEPAEPISDAQMRKLGATFTRIGISDRGERLRVSATLVGRPLMTSRELTRREASTLIDTLATVADQPDAAARLRAMVDELEQAAELLAESTDADDGEPVDGELVDDPAPTSGGPVDWPPVTQPGTG